MLQETRQIDLPPKNHKFIRKMDSFTVAAAVREFAAPATGRKSVQILRPFAVVSKSELSVPLALPIGPAYLAALLERAGYQVDLIDAVGEGIAEVASTSRGRFRRLGLSPERILERIAPETSVLGVSLMFSQEWVEHKRLLNRIRQARPELVIVAGSEHASAMSEYVLRDCPAIDGVVRGEGELTFLRIVHGVVNGRSIREIPGASYIDSKGNTWRAWGGGSRTSRTCPVRHGTWSRFTSTASPRTATASIAASACRCSQPEGAPSSAHSVPALICGPPAI